MSKKRITLHMAWNYRKILAKKTHAVTVRLSENQMEFIKKEAAQRDISVSKYIHRILFIGDWTGPTVEEQKS